jgi:hypothetical protein
MVTALSKRTLLACFVLLAVALATAFALTHSGTSVAGDDAPAARDARDGFGVFDRPARSGDTLPPQTRRMFASFAAEEGLDIDQARAVAPSGPGYVWALPGPSKVCLAIPDLVDGFGVGCEDAAGAADGRLWVSMHDQGGATRIALLVPDGTNQVTAVSASGGRRALDISDNVAFAGVAESDRLEFAIGGSSHSVDVPDGPEG